MDGVHTKSRNRLKLEKVVAAMRIKMKMFRDRSAAARMILKQKEKMKKQKAPDVDGRNVEDTLSADEEDEQQQPEEVEEDDIADLIFDHLNMVDYSEEDADGSEPDMNLSLKYLFG